MAIKEREREREKPSMAIGWVFSILAVTSLGIWWAIILGALQWLWK
jgi:hypothetical protein